MPGNTILHAVREDVAKRLQRYLRREPSERNAEHAIQISGVGLAVAGLMHPFA